MSQVSPFRRSKPTPNTIICRFASYKNGRPVEGGGERQVRRRNAIAAVSVAIALALVFFFAPVVSLPTVRYCRGQASPFTQCTAPDDFIVKRVGSPSSALMGFGVVRYDSTNGTSCPSSGMCQTYTLAGYVFTWNCSDLAQYLR
jgi:hypothetical protein